MPISFGNGGVGIDALWDFLYKPVDGKSLKCMSEWAHLWLSMMIFLGARGKIGREYQFQKAPIVIGLDWRPTLWIVEETDFHAGGFGLNVRYVFLKIF